MKSISTILFSLFFTGFTVKQHWKSAAACAAALELPNLNYAHMLELKPKDK